jgi:acyl-CoA reductase-like NAD-dependent aldehyde dehydrogenase
VIVEADADLDDAAATLAGNAFSFAGQSCISVRRIYVHRDAYDAFVERFVPRVQELKVGDPADEDTDVGPVIDEDARARILEWIAESGGTLLTGGDATDEGLIRPTVIARPRLDAKVVCEEIFGAVCTLTPYEILEEALALANATRYGLQAGIFTRDAKTRSRPPGRWSSAA